MMKHLKHLTAITLLLNAAPLTAGTLYVSLSSTNPLPPYTNWATAAVTIQAAVDAAVDGDQVVVTNGNYATGARMIEGNPTSNRVAVTNAITVRSVNGPAVTAIIGAGPVGPAGIRCVYLNDGAVLDGFTLTNGATQYLTNVDQDPSTFGGGGVRCEPGYSSSAVVTNCVLTGNSSWAQGGGAYGGTLNKCTLTENFNYGGGGGAAFSKLNDCTLSDNRTLSSGGGAYSATLNRCTLTGNISSFLGGGANESELNDCILTQNSAEEGGGAGYCWLNRCILTDNLASRIGGGATGWLTNCTLTGNFAPSGGGASGVLYNCILRGNLAMSMGGGVYKGKINNCTLLGNYCQNSGGGAADTTLINCILYDNTATFNANYDLWCTLTNCCTTPLPAGPGNITNAPLFVDAAAGDFRLLGASPGVNAGNNAYAVGPDLAGNPRIVAGIVDMGAFEFQGTNSLLFYDWLQTNGVTPNGLTDYLDADLDGVDNWKEWVCGTSPTNAASVLRLLSAVPVGANVNLSWQSVAGINYFLQRATNLAPAAFRTIAPNLPGQPGTTTYVDTNSAGLSPLYYRVGVRGSIQLANEWKFEANANDTSGNGNDGTIIGSPSYVAGKFGQAIYLNRADSIQRLNALNLPVAGASSWSCNVWLYLTNAPDSLAYLCGFGNTSSTSPRGTARGLLAYGGSGNNGIYSWGAELDLLTGQSYPLNNWTMVTVTHDGITGTRRIWIDANLAATGVYPLNNTSSTISAGVTAWTGKEFQGALDEFTIWSGVLGTNETRSLYTNNDIIH